MKTAEEIVKDLLFKDKPKSAYSKKVTFDDLLEAIQQAQQEAYNEGRDQTLNWAFRTYGLTSKGMDIDDGKTAIQFTPPID